MSDTILMGAFYKCEDGKIIPLPPYCNYSDDWIFALDTIASYLLDKKDNEQISTADLRKWINARR